MTDTATPTPTPPATPEPESRRPRLDRPVSLRKVLAAAGVLIILGTAFVGGMEFKSWQIRSAMQEAFGDIGDDIDENVGETSTEDDTDLDFADTDADSQEDGVEPVELVEDEPISVDLEDGGQIQVMLRSMSESAGGSADESAARNVEFNLRIKNTGTSGFDPMLGGNFESDEGEVFELSRVMCEEDDLGYETVNPGQFVKGCVSYDLPAEAGRVNFELGTPFFITVPVMS